VRARSAAQEAVAGDMDIHFISTLNPEDEDRFAPMVIGAVRAILDLLPISYTLRIETANARVFQHAKAETIGEPHVTEVGLAGGSLRRFRAS
jgi:hypothetical protein